MPDTTAQGTNSISLEAKVIRADGTEEDLGVIAESEPSTDEEEEE